jgi:hypothetical protein
MDVRVYHLLETLGASDGIAGRPVDSTVLRHPF